MSGPNLGVEFGVCPVENPSRNSHPKFHIKHCKLSGIVSCDSVAIRLRFGYGFESRDANGPRNVKNTNLAKHRPVFPPHFSLLIVLGTPRPVLTLMCV